MDIYLYKSDGNSTKDVKGASPIGPSELQGLASLFKIYSLDYSKNEQFQVVVVPREESTDTKFDMQYWVDGTEMSSFVAWFSGLFGSLGGFILIYFIVIALLFPMICCVVYICCQKKFIDHKQVKEAVHQKIIANKGDLVQEYIENNHHAAQKVQLCKSKE